MVGLRQEKLWNEEEEKEQAYEVIKYTVRERECHCSQEKCHSKKCEVVLLWGRTSLWSKTGESLHK